MQDDFNTENLSGEQCGNDAIWKVTDGFLRVEVKRNGR